jgi:hypothetical protein
MTDKERIEALSKVIRWIYADGRFKGVIKRYIIQAGLNAEELIMQKTPKTERICKKCGGDPGPDHYCM